MSTWSVLSRVRRIVPALPSHAAQLFLARAASGSGQQRILRGSLHRVLKSAQNDTKPKDPKALMSELVALLDAPSTRDKEEFPPLHKLSLLHFGSQGKSLQKTVDVFRTLPAEYPFTQLPHVAAEMLHLVREEASLGQPRLMKEFEQLETVEDALYAWKVVSCMSSIVQEFNWDHESVVEMIGAIIVHLKKASIEQLISFVQHLSLLHFHPSPIPKYVLDLSFALDKECSRRLLVANREWHSQQDDTLSTPAGREPFLKCAYSWVKWHEASFTNVQEFSCRYGRKMIEVMLQQEEMLALLNDREIIFLLFQAGQLKYFPPVTNVLYKEEEFEESVNTASVNHNARKPHIELPRSLGARLEKAIPKLWFEEVGIIAHVIYQVPFKIPAESRRIHDHLISVVLLTNDRSVMINDFTLSSIFKVIRTRQSPNRRNISAILSKFQPLLQHLEPSTKIRMLSMLTVKCPANTEDFIATVVKDFLKTDLCSLRIKELDRLVFALYHLGYTADVEIYHKIFQAIEFCSHKDPRAGRSLLFVNYILSKLGLFNADHLEQIFSAANALKPQLLKLEDVKDQTSLAVDLAFNLGRQSGYNAEEESLFKNRERSRAANLYENIFFNVASIDFDLQLNGFNYEGTKLDPELRQFVFRQRRAGIKHNSKTPTFYQKLLSTVENDLIGIIGEDNLVRCNILPHIDVEDFVFCIEKTEDGNIMPKIPCKEFINQTVTIGQNVEKPPSDYGHWFTLPVFKISHYDAAGNPLGFAAYKKRCLQDLGFNVIDLQPIIYEKLLKSSNYFNRRDYLKGLVRQETKKLWEEEK